MQLTNSNTNIRLTSLSKSSGCGCKISPEILNQILTESRNRNEFSNLLVGNSSNDDAAVYKYNDETCFVSTTDFFTPIVDDPYDFGKIAAANSISDIYAMGAKPIFALAILGWPIGTLSPEQASFVMKGAKSITDSIGIPIAGGHSVNITQPLFGLVVNGIINPRNIKTNAAAKEGDFIFMTKPLGNGILSTAFKKELLNDADYKIWLKNMTDLNTIGADLAELDFVHAMTDITGFGLLGHLGEIAEASGLSAEINFSSIPILEATNSFITSFCFPDSTYKNWNAWEKKTNTLSPSSFIPLNDPQTSGGLLFSAERSKLDEVQAFLRKHNLEKFSNPIGRFTRKSDLLLNVIEA